MRDFLSGFALSFSSWDFRLPERRVLIPSNATMTQDMLSHPEPSPLVSGAKHALNNYKTDRIIDVNEWTSN